MKVLVDLADKDLDKALETLGILRKQLNDHQQQHESLKMYLQEYVDKINNEGLSLMPIQLQTTQSFLDKLNSAIFSQGEKVVEMTEIVNKAEENWTEKRSRSKALQKLFAKIQKNATALLEKQEQNILDELSSLQFIQRKNNTLHNI